MSLLLTSSKLGEAPSARDQVESLVETFLAGLGAQKSRRTNTPAV